MKKQCLFALAPVVLLSMASGTAQARDIAKDFPITQKNDLYCVTFEDKQEHCTQTKSQLTSEASESQYQQVMRMKRSIKSPDFNKSIIDAFVDNKMTVLEFQYLKNQVANIEAKSNALGKNSN